MSAFVVCRGLRPSLYPLLGCLAVTLAAIASPQSVFATEPVPQSTVRDPVTVRLDQAKLLRLPERTSTLVVGNPLIADAVVQPGGVVVITAKSYGMTNIVALDRTGTALSEYPVQVVGPADATVVVQRAMERETYSCAPNCERRITLGDFAAYFTSNLTAVGALSSQAMGEQKK